MNEGQQQQEWMPQTEGLQQIIQLLKESQSIDNTVQKNVQKVKIFIFNQSKVIAYLEFNLKYELNRNSKN